MWATAVGAWRLRKQMALVVGLAQAVAGPACGSSNDGSVSHPAETRAATVARRTGSLCFERSRVRR